MTRWPRALNLVALDLQYLSDGETDPSFRALLRNPRVVFDEWNQFYQL